MTQKSAIISACSQYRYLLTRTGTTADLIDQRDRGTVLFLMLNPSTADASVDDRTIRRCRGFALSWSYGSLAVANLYALRATNPKDLWLHHDPVGPENDAWLAQLAAQHTDIVCAWGSNAKIDRVNDVVGLLEGARLWCLGTNKDGSPKHPLYIPSNHPLIPWSP